MVDPVFGLYFWGKVLSGSGIWVHNVVAAIVVYQVTGSASMVGLVSAVQFAPQLLLAPLSGKLADRGNAPAQIALGRLLTGSGSVGLAGWLWAVGGVEGLSGAAPVVLSSAVVGLGFVVGGPAMQSIVPSLVRPGELAAATSLDGAPMILGRAVGPALGAVVALRLGPAAAFAMAGATSLLHSLVVVWLRLPRGVPGKDDDLSIRTSLRYVRSEPALLALLLGTAAVAVGAEPSVTLAPVLAAEVGGGAGLAGWLASAFGIGSAAGFLLYSAVHRWFGEMRLSGGGLLVMAGGLVAAAASSSPGVALGSFAVVGLGMTLALTSITTAIQMKSPDALRGRIMALWFVGFLGARPFAAALDGFLADATSVRVALLVSAGFVAGTAVLCRPSRLARAPSGSAVPDPPLCAAPAPALTPEQRLTTEAAASERDRDDRRDGRRPGHGRSSRLALRRRGARHA